MSAPCKLTTFVNAWVDSPFSGWLPNSASTGSEWSTPYDGESPVGEGWYVYRTRFHVPSVLPSGSVPKGVIIRGQLASDNAVYGIYLASPGLGGTCALVAGQPFPVNPPDHVGYTDFDQWWPFSFKEAVALSPGTDAFLYFAVENYYYSPAGGPSSQGLRVEFFDTSAFY